ncbi:MAG: hypothetical protein JEZ06_20845 [Anaerolineaceae bacterium]|nr:hypothetical protein [Anaerolineaceae bacterium]
METVPERYAKIDITDYQQAWELVISQLRMEMRQVFFETWIQPLRPLGYQDGVFQVGAVNKYTRNWVLDRLDKRITNLLEGVYNRKIQFEIIVGNDLLQEEGRPRERIDYAESISITDQPDEDILDPKPGRNGSKKDNPRKLKLQRAYGDKRAAVIQPERTLFVTHYLFTKWIPHIKHSGFSVILAARSMCYWNPLNNELRNEVETEMKELAELASVSVRTVKTVLNDEIVKKYFLRYKARRVVTENGIRSAGILLQVRMDDPLTPEDQVLNGIEENEHWYAHYYDNEKKS